jgi:two-component system, cell cycle response regulator
MSLPRILLVDDVKLFLELEKSYLNLTQAQVLTAANGQEALELVRSKRPDLVFLDLYMPVLDGKACCMAIKDDPELAAIPVVMVTTGGKSEEVDLCRAAGCDGLLTKPIDRSAFLDMVSRFIPSFKRR